MTTSLIKKLLKPPDPTEKPGRLPLLLSALIWPGAGQIAQRRIGPAIFFAITFTAALAVFFIDACMILYTLYDVALSSGSQVDPSSLAARKMWLGLSLLLAVLLYAAGLIDTALAHKSACTRWAKQKWHVPPERPREPPPITS